MIWTRDLLEKLKTDTKKAEEKEKAIFVFEGQELFVPYAKYLIEYLDRLLKPAGAKR